MEKDPTARPVYAVARNSIPSSEQRVIEEISSYNIALQYYA